MRHKTTSRDGFTIMELMVVVALIILFLSVSVPSIYKIEEISRDRTGVNTIGVAVAAARAYATQRIPDDDNVPAAEFSGACVVFTTENQMRIAQDIQDAGAEAAGASRYSDSQSGTTAARMETITLPKGIGAVGIHRIDGQVTPAGFSMLTPPFAIRFNRHGQLIAGSDTTRLVYYGTYPGAARGAFNLKEYDPDFGNPTKRAWLDGPKRYDDVPFNQLETVVGVITYSKADFEDAGGSWPGTVPTLGCGAANCTNIAEWMFKNGTVIFFNPNTGSVIRRNAP